MVPQPELFQPKFQPRNLLLLQIANPDEESTYTRPVALEEPLNLDDIIMVG